MTKFLRSYNWITVFSFFVLSLSFLLGGMFSALSQGMEGSTNLEWIYSRPAGISFTRSEVTVSQFRQCLSAGRCSASNVRTDADCNWGQPDRESHPINCINWYGAKQFCEWAGGRLPTHGEWYSEASNDEKRDFAWGEESPSCNLAIIRESSINGCGRSSTWPVCSKPRGNSVSGLCDMTGNVEEWVSTEVRELIPGTQPGRMLLLGCSYNCSNPSLLRTSSITSIGPDVKSKSYGFRCVKGGAASISSASKTDNSAPGWDCYYMCLKWQYKDRKHPSGKYFRDIVFENMQTAYREKKLKFEPVPNWKKNCRCHSCNCFWTHPSY